MRGSVVDAVDGVVGDAVDDGGLSGVDAGVVGRVGVDGRVTTGRDGGGACLAGSGVAGFVAAVFAGVASVAAGAVVDAPVAAAAGTGAVVAGMGGGATVGAAADASSDGPPRSRLRNNQPPTTATASRATAIIPCRRLRAGSSCGESIVTAAPPCPA